MPESFLGGKVTLHLGDCMEVLQTLPADSVDACVCDPPYGLEFMGKEWDKFGKEAKHRSFERSGYGLPRFGAWTPTASVVGIAKVRKGNVGFQEFSTLWANEVYRVLKPGAHLLAFGGTRTYHRMACAIEDAGFEIRDCIQWLYGSGFPKSHNQGNGWGTALKPACEPIVLARKPLSEKTVAANVLRWGTGAINVDGCRVGTAQDQDNARAHKGRSLGFYANGERMPEVPSGQVGRWPANIIHDGSEEVVKGFPETGISNGRDSIGRLHQAFTDDARKSRRDDIHEGFDDEGSAARFFYTAKADSDDRIGSKHPTVKPLDLMRYLVRLVCPKGGLVLDCFAGTGTTGEAAFREGCKAVLIERESEYQIDVRRRMELCLAGPDERIFKSQKARQDGKPIDAGPLFDGLA